MSADPGPYPNDPAVELPGPSWTVFEFLDQSEWWKPADLATAVRVEDLDPGHQRRLLAFLRRHADAYASWYFDLALSFLLTARGEMAQMDAEHACAEALDVCDNPSAWLEDQPLVVRLRELTEARAHAGDGPEWWE